MSKDPPGKVGYGRPPVEHQFKKGRSGNPLGRPKGTGRSVSTGRAGVRLANALLIHEAYRTVTIREGEKVVQLPAIQAIFRAWGVTALKGNRFAQRTLAELVQKVEQENDNNRIEHFKALVDYKRRCEEEMEAARLRGEAIPCFLPHPDDIIIDLLNGRATVNGPSTKEELAEWNLELRGREDMQRLVSKSAETFRTARSPSKKERARECWLANQKAFDLVNDNFPKRYRQELEDRCYDDDASRPMQQRKIEWPGEF